MEITEITRRPMASRDWAKEHGCGGRGGPTRGLAHASWARVRPGKRDPRGTGGQEAASQGVPGAPCWAAGSREALGASLVLAETLVWRSHRQAMNTENGSGGACSPSSDHSHATDGETTGSKSRRAAFQEGLSVIQT